MSFTRRMSVFACLALVASTVVLIPVAEAARPRCFGRRATIVGTPGDDTLRGTPRADVIVAKGGTDAIVGRGGNDLVCAGKGRDSIELGGGSDRAAGGTGSDSIGGGAGSDRIFLEGGSEEFAAGGNGSDVIDLGPGFFQIAVGGAGNDEIIGFSPEPGGSSLDLVGYNDAPGPVEVDLAAGQATGHGSDTLISIEGVEGSEFDDALTGTSGSNFLFGGAGNDVINDGGNDGNFSMDPSAVLDEFHFDALGGDFADEPTGNDTLNGQGSGLHVVFFEGSAGVTVDLQQGTATGQGSDTLSGINVVAAGAGNDTLRGDSQDNGFDGGAGNDSFDGRAGDDTVIMFDAIGAVADLSTGTASGQYLTFTGGTEEDRPFTWSLAGMENLWGSVRGGDTLRGSNTPNEIFGLAGPDQLFGLAGPDLLNGGDGADTGDGGEGSDQCVDVETPTNCESSGTPFLGRATFESGWSAIRSLLTAARQ